MFGAWKKKLWICCLDFQVARVQVWALGCLKCFMRMPFLVICAFLFIGCASSQPKDSLSAQQATRLAIQLANTKAEAAYQRQPFHDGETARFESGGWACVAGAYQRQLFHDDKTCRESGVWVWEELAPGDIEAEVEIAADGSTNRVSLNLLSDVVDVP